MSAPEMRRSWLVQRLNPPRGHDNPFSFGGGLRNGGLSANAMDLLRGVWSFDYMGAAEFEFGAVPEALSKIAETKSRHLGTHSLTLRVPDDVAGPWMGEEGEVAPHERTVFVLGRKDWHAEIERRIRGWAARDDDPDFHTKESPHLHSALRPGRYTPDVQGWLELNNGFLFFIDEEMFLKAASLFGARVERGAA